MGGSEALRRHAGSAAASNANPCLTMVFKDPDLMAPPAGVQISANPAAPRLSQGKRPPARALPAPGVFPKPCDRRKSAPSGPSKSRSVRAEPHP